MSEKTFYYVCFWATRTRENPRWSPPCTSLAEAGRLARQHTDDGTASLAFVVEIGPAGRAIHPELTQPGPDRRTIRRYLELDDELERREEEDRTRRGETP